MTNEKDDQPSEQHLSKGKLVDQEPLEDIEEPSVRLAGYNQLPDFGNDIKGTLKDDTGSQTNE